MLHGDSGFVKHGGLVEIVVPALGSFNAGLQCVYSMRVKYVRGGAEASWPRESWRFALGCGWYGNVVAFEAR